MAKQFDQTMLRMALVGYEVEIQRIQAAMAEIRSRLGQRPGHSTNHIAVDPAPGPKHHMSVAARKRIAAAQKKRWAVYHAKTGESSTAAPKRKLSPERRAALAANLAKARAARAAKNTAA